MECARYSNYFNPGFDPDNVRCETKGSNSIAVMALTYNEPKGREGLGRKVTEVVLQHYMRRPSLKEVGLQKMTEFAHDAVCVEQSPGYAAECDLAVLMTQGNKFRWVCTGGARIFYFLNGQIMESSSGRTPRLGNGREKEMPDVLQETEFTKGENSFLICSDTFCKYVSEAEMENALAASENAEEWLKALKNLYEDRCTDEPFALMTIFMPQKRKRLPKKAVIAIIIALVVLAVGAFFALGAARRKNGPKPGEDGRPPQSQGEPSQPTHPPEPERPERPDRPPQGQEGQEGERPTEPPKPTQPPQPEKPKGPEQSASPETSVIPEISEGPEATVSMAPDASL